MNGTVVRMDMEDGEWLRHLAAVMESAPREGGPTDHPEGDRRVAMSETLANLVIARLRRIGKKLEDDEDRIVELEGELAEANTRLI